MFTYNIEYRENILFIRLIGDLDEYFMKQINSELDNIINVLGISNIVFNISNLDNIDSTALNDLINWYNLINNGKGVSLICGGYTHLKNILLLNNIKILNNELSAIKLINWNN